MSLRDAFERLGVPDHLLAQVIWAEFDGESLSPEHMLDIARRVFPEDICSMIEAQLRRSRPRGPKIVGLAEGRELLRQTVRRA